MFRGEYVVTDEAGHEVIIPNTVLQVGQTRIMEAAFQAATKTIATFLVGVFDEVPAYNAVVADITTEPSSAGGYARQSLPGDIANWTITSENAEAKVESATATFTATGADFSRSFSRFFLMESGGELISYSSPLQNSVTLLDGQSYAVRYRVFYK